MSERPRKRWPFDSRSAVVVDLAVEDRPDRPVFIGHRLIAGRREINDAETGVQERRLGPRLYAPSVGPAMAQRAQNLITSPFVEIDAAK